MKAPIERELQIEMMKQAKERSDALSAKWKADEGVRAMLRRPSPKQKAPDAPSEVTTEVPLRKCA